MNLDSDSPIWAAFDWVERLIPLQIELLEDFQFFSHGLHENRPDPGDQFIARGMADCPRDLHRCLSDLVVALNERRVNSVDHFSLVEMASASMSRPIPCGGYYVLTAFEALPEWANHILDAIEPFASATWNYPDSAPNWASHGMTNREWRRCWEECRHAAKKIKPVSVNRLQWAEARLRAEWNCLLVYWPEDGDPTKVRKSSERKKRQSKNAELVAFATPLIEEGVAWKTIAAQWNAANEGADATAESVRKAVGRT